MHSLKDSNRQVYKMFSEGNFVIRCNYKKWTGLESTDLVTELVLARSLKSNGERTQRAGSKETQRGI